MPSIAWHGRAPVTPRWHAGQCCASLSLAQPIDATAQQIWAIPTAAFTRGRQGPRFADDPPRWHPMGVGQPGPQRDEAALGRNAIPHGDSARMGEILRQCQCLDSICRQRGNGANPAIAWPAPPSRDRDKIAAGYRDECWCRAPCGEGWGIGDLPCGAEPARPRARGCPGAGHDAPAFHNGSCAAGANAATCPQDLHRRPTPGRGTGAAMNLPLTQGRS
jgi:hypothetical protein